MNAKLAFTAISQIPLFGRAGGHPEPADRSLLVEPPEQLADVPQSSTDPVTQRRDIAANLRHQRLRPDLSGLSGSP
jgi:hypothetical protein